MSEKEFRVPADGEVHTLVFSGQMVPVDAVVGKPMFLHAEADAVVFKVQSAGTSLVERSFQVVGSGQPSPADGRFIETVLAPTQELRWWHLFEIGSPA